MQLKNTLNTLYRLAYILGVASLIASIALMWPAQGNLTRVQAQDAWFLSQFCGGFDLDAPVHPDMTVRVQFRPLGAPSWGGTQTWNVPAGGPATYTFIYNPAPAPGSEVLVNVVGGGGILFNYKDDVAPCQEPSVTPTNTLPPPSVTPTFTPTVTNTPVTPTDTPTATATQPTSTPTATGTQPTSTPTATGTQPTATFTATATQPTATFTATATQPTATPTATGTLPTPTPTATGTLPTSTPTSTPPVFPPDPTATPTSPQQERTPVPSPPSSGGDPPLIPVTGVDLNGQLLFMQKSLMNLGVGLLGLGLVLHGFSLRFKREE